MIRWIRLCQQVTEQDIKIQSYKVIKDKRDIAAYLNRKMITEALKVYKYNPNKPSYTISAMDAFDAQNKDNGNKVTLKILKRPKSQLINYLNKLKGLVSDYTIKIIDLVFQAQTNKLLIVQERNCYGNLKKALAKCKRLQDEDALFISKLMLNGHIQILRAGIFWFGDQTDIEFTENGMKLSWNNSCQFSQMNNPFPGLIQRISVRPDINTLLPFPKSKSITDLIKVSRENASEISLHPLLKKKQKLIKKKGKDWIGIKQYKVKGQYFTQFSYLAVSQAYGFVRVKIFDKGELNPDLIKIYQTKPSFVKIFDHYQDKQQFITITQYANDGTVQSYVKKLKNNSIALKQSQIQFFFFSMIEPLKYLHRNFGSINMLHIRNVYIQDGIPKIGQPIPLTPKINEMLGQRSDVPDFYHKDFKITPLGANNPSYDTYSLGVLLYKLMYTEYPIFPQGKVHIPTTPSYKKQLKSSLELFLNVGGNLQDLQKEIQIADQVKNQVKENQRLLAEGNKANKRQKIMDAFNEQYPQYEGIQQASAQQKKEGGKQVGALKRFWIWINSRSADSGNKYQQLYNSHYTAYRTCVTVITVLLFYLLTFFMLYINGNINLLAHTRLFQQFQVVIAGKTHKVVGPNYDTFNSTYTKHLSTNASLGVKILNQSMMCRVDDNGAYYDFIRPDSPHWYLYLIISIFAMILLLIAKGIMLGRFSIAKVGYHYYDKSTQGSQQSRFALSSYVFNQLWWAFSLFSFYVIFNYIYHEQHSPCFGGLRWSAITYALFNERIKFATVHLLPVCFVWTFSLLSMLQTTAIYKKIPYNKLLNPIFIFTPFYVALFILIRIGALSEFYPSFVNSQGIIGTSYLDIIGYFPELLVVIQILLSLLIDYIFLKCVDKRIQKFLIDYSFSEEFQEYGNLKS